jgi:hypothetical protein
MVQVKKMPPPSTSTHRSATNYFTGSTPPYLIWIVKILLALLILFLLPKLVQSSSRQRQRIDRGLRTIRQECELNVCTRNPTRIPEESLNCILACVSPACYQVVYGETPLKDGEIDLVRGQVFDKCARDEYMRMRKRQRAMLQYERSNE